MNKRNNNKNSNPSRSTRGTNGKPKYNGSRNRKPYNKDDGSRSNSREIDSTANDRGDINNPAYYYGDATVLDQVMNFSFNQFGGVPFNVDLDPGNNLSATAHNTMIATYYLNPSVPTSMPFGVGNYIAGATTAALRNYLALSGSNAKTTNYAPQDVIILELAVAEIIKVATFLARAFGVTPLFNYRNRSYPEALLSAMGIDPVTLMQNLAAHRVRYNKLLTLASKIPFPADIPILQKASEVYSYIYLDDPSSALAQTYMFVPYSVWLFDEAYDSNGAGLRTTSLITPGTLTNMSIILNTFESMISALLNSTSLNYIYSDIMRLVQANKLTKLITFNSIPEDFLVMPVYNEEVKMWIHNAFIMGAPLATASQYNPQSVTLTNSNDLCCDASSNDVIYHPEFMIPVDSGFEAIIDFDHDNVTIEDKVRATRLSQRHGEIIKDTSNRYYAIENALADEYLVQVSFYTGENLNSNLTLSHSFQSISSVGTAIGICDIISKFDWAPILYRVSGNDLQTIGDLDYYTTLNEHVLKRIYDYEIIHLLQIG